MFRKKPDLDEEGFVATAVPAAGLAEGEMLPIKIGKRRLVLARVTGEVVAFDDTCPHGAASLATGGLRDELVCCPDHGYCFNMIDGSLAWPADEPYRLRRFATKIVNGLVRVHPEPL